MKREKISQKPQIIIIIGPPGSGKGMQANLLAERFGLYNFETSKIGESAIALAKEGQHLLIKGKRYYFDQEKKRFQSGKLWSVPFIDHLVFRKIKELASRQKGIVFQGTPRTIEEAKAVMPLLVRLYEKEKVLVFLLELGLKHSVWRNSHRRICELLRHPLVYNKETAGLTLCPLDGSRLRRRSLDRPEIIKKRFLIYEKETLPMIDFLEERGFLAQRIDGQQSVAKVFETIVKIMGPG